MLKKIGIGLLVLLVVLFGAGYWLLYTTEPSDGAWPLDLAEIRRLASSVEGSKPTDVRFERITGFKFPSSAVVPKSGLSMTEMDVYSYQLVFPDRIGIVDTAMNEATSKSGPVTGFEVEAFARVEKAMAASDFIVITHEHADHFGGLLTHPNPKQVFAHAVLTPEQLADPKHHDPVPTPPEAKDAKQLVYEKAAAIAPGVVLIHTPGHTPGSQLVYVQKEDGTELIFLGDVAWHEDNVKLTRERSRLATMLIGEDRHAVQQQLQALHDVQEKEPKLLLVPGHEKVVVDRLAAAGALHEKFVELPVATP